VLSLFFAFRPYFRPYRLRLGLGLAALVLAIGAELAQPWPLKLVVDSVLGDHPLPSWMPQFVREGSPDTQIAVLSLMLVFLVAVGSLLNYVGTYLSQAVGQRVTFEIREAVHNHMHRLSLAYHHSQRPGDLASRLTSDAQRIQTVVISVIVTLLTSIVTLVGMLAIMLSVSWEFTLLALASTPLLAVTIFRYKRRIKLLSRQAREHEGLVAARVQESLGAIQLVQAYTREDHELEQFRRDARGSLESNIQVTTLQARFAPVLDVLTAVAAVTVIWVGAHKVRDGSLTLGLLLVFLSYVRGFYRPLKQLSRLSFLISKGTASAERLSEVMATEPELPSASHPYKPRRVSGAVSFDRVSFTYPLGEDVTLHDVSFRADPGKVVALVGPTGAGKTTIVSLIPRFYDADSGTVAVDGVDVRDWELRHLRSNVSLVLQETWLFQASILENIAYGRPGASLEEIERAAVAASADEFIQALPDGYETTVGPRGATLSGGQRQRIAIARAMLRDAPILILDEPTTGLDRVSEQLVIDGLRRLMADRTTIVIAHGEVPIVAADEIVVVEDGRIVERGTHDELLHTTGARYGHLRGLRTDHPG
jgi:ATP-binding cassette, subfamily B, bacterial